MSQEHLLVEVVISLFLVVLACGSGYWMARFLPVRFNGEKALIGLITGCLVTPSAIYGLDKLMNDRVRVFEVTLPIGWFSLQGLAGEATVQAICTTPKN